MSNSVTASQQIIFSISSGVPDAARALIWDIFFSSRQRGIDLHTHFPWIERKVGTYCLMFSEKNNSACVATLILRTNYPCPKTQSAMIGMVCVDRAWRGLGLSTRLLTNVLTFAAEQQINSLLLWTTQPGIYIRHGFRSDAEICDTYGRVTLNPLRPRRQMEFSKGKPSASHGLPPFGLQLTHFESAATELIGVETDGGVALAEWKGSPPAVLNLIETVLPSTWSLNAPSGAFIFDEISNRGHFYTPLPCAIRMVRHLGTPIYIPYISILERI